MTQKNLSVEEIKAVAEAAITAKQAATDARKAADEAEGADDALNAAAEAAEQASKAASDKAEALSHQPAPIDTEKPKKVAKLKRKKAIIENELRNLGESADYDEDDDEGDDLDDPERPLTVGDLQRIEARKAQATAVEMAESIEDVVARDAVKAALKRVVPSGDPQKDFADAVSIANREKNSKVLEEIGRRGAPNQHRSGAGAPPKPSEAFVMTDDEAKFVAAGWLTVDDVKKARDAAPKS